MDGNIHRGGNRLSVDDRVNMTNTPQIGRTRKFTQYSRCFDNEYDRADDFEVEKKLNDLTHSQERALKKKTRFKEPIVEEHRTFKEVIHHEEPRSIDTKIKKVMAGNQSSHDTHEMTSSHTYHTSNNNVHSASIRNNHNDFSENTGNNEALNAYIRKFLTKELTKVRHDCRENNNLLSQNIAQNEEFYFQKFDDMQKKIKNDMVSKNDAQTLISNSVSTKLSQSGIKDQKDKSKQEVSKMEAQINALVSHFKTSQEQIKNLTNDLEETNKRLETIERDSEHFKRTTSHKIEVLDKGVNNVREDCMANTDSFMVSVESRLDSIDHNINISENKKREIKKIPILEQPRIHEPLVDQLREDINSRFQIINKRMDNFESDVHQQFETSRELDNKINKLHQVETRNIKDINEKITEIMDQVDNTEMDVNKKFNIMKTTTNASFTQSTKQNIDKSMESRLGRCETIAVRHGKALDVLTNDVNALIEEEPKVIIKEKRSPCV